MTYALEITALAERRLRKLFREPQQRLRDGIEELADSPRPLGCRKLSGYHDVYRIRVGSYRVIYSVDDERVIVLIIKLGHRRAVYRR